MCIEYVSLTVPKAFLMLRKSTGQKCVDLYMLLAKCRRSSPSNRRSAVETQAYVIITQYKHNEYVGYLWGCDFWFENCETANNMGFASEHLLSTFTENNANGKQYRMRRTRHGKKDVVVESSKKTTRKSIGSEKSANKCLCKRS